MLGNPVEIVLDRLIIADAPLPEAVLCYGASVDAALLSRFAQAILMLGAADIVRLIDIQHTREIVCPLWFIDSFRKNPTTWIAENSWDAFLLRMTPNGRQLWTGDRAALVRRLRPYLIPQIVMP